MVNKIQYWTLAVEICSLGYVGQYRSNREREIEMTDTMELIRQANQELEDNRDKVIHNFDCDFSRLQPYDNKALLAVIRHMNLLIADTFKVPKELIE